VEDVAAYEACWNRGDPLNEVRWRVFNRMVEMGAHNQALTRAMQAMELDMSFPKIEKTRFPEGAEL